MGIPDLEQWLDFALKGIFTADVVADLDVVKLTGAFSDEIDLFVVKFADIDFETTAQELQTDDVFVNAAIIHVARAEHGVAHTGVAEIIFFRAFQVFFAADVIALDRVEEKSAA